MLPGEQEAWSLDQLTKNGGSKSRSGSAGQ